MDIFIWSTVIFLVLLAVFHLVTGVSNDAVNFLNAAIGSRVASSKVILAVAGAGLIVGTFFSGGMMEVVRNGVINPSGFLLHELLIIVVAVTVANILLLDGFNTAGFPTSTTISLIFSLIGAALAIVLIKQNTQGDLEDYSAFINTDRIFIIFAGILISIFFAFVIGATAQFLTRLIFTFQHQGKYNFLFSAIGALAITTIFYLLIKKGIGGTFWEENIQWLQNLGTKKVLISVYLGSALSLWGLATLFHIDIPRLVVFFGTFALALSFASNDLVNFIGLPLTGIESIKEYLNTPDASFTDFPLQFLNTDWERSLHFRDSVYVGFFLLTGIVMMITLFVSKKLRTVTETEVYLGRQSAGQERFEPSPLSKVLVRGFFNVYQKAENILPVRLHALISDRFKPPLPLHRQPAKDEVIYFDTVRASVNLVIASLLISVGTYLRFPLSTTFVVFMVAMGTSFADQAWGRESAVYRLSGVLSILGGWFITASAGFMGAFLFALALHWGSWPVALALFLIVLVTLWQTNKYHKQKTEKEKELNKTFHHEKTEGIEWLRETGRERIRKFLLESSKIYFMIIDALMDEDLRQMREAIEKTEYLQLGIKNYKMELFRTYSKLPEEIQDSGHLFVQALDYLTETSNTLCIMAPPVFKHLENQHKGLSLAQKEDLFVILEETTAFLNFLIHFEKEKRFDAIHELKNKQNLVIKLLEDKRLEQIRRIRSGQGRSRVNVIYMEVMGETKNILIYSLNLFQALREFCLQTPKKPVR
jgi:phosphate/sulfate permease